MPDTMNGLRALTSAEVDAVALHMQKVPVGEVAERTGLTAAQIAAAVDQAGALARYGAARARQVADAPVKLRNPAPVTIRAPKPADAPETVDWDAELADTPGEGLVPIDVPVIDRATGLAVELPAEPDDATETLLSRAEASPQPRARQLATEVRNGLAELEQLLGNDEKVRVLAATIGVLREQLAKNEAELATLVGNTPPMPAAVKPAPRIEPPAAAASTSTMRAWAERNGWEVKGIGRLPGAVVAAYNKAHEGAA